MVYQTKINKKLLRNLTPFFTNIGVQISESVNKTIKQPDDYLTEKELISDLDLHIIGPVEVCDIAKQMTSKGSSDIDGLSTKLLKNIIHEISTPLAHIFSLSVTTGKFPSKLKTSRTVPVHKSRNTESCDN